MITQQKTKFKLLFKVPTQNDWVLWVYATSVVFDSLGSISTVVKQGGPFLGNTAAIFSGSIDALMHLVVSYILVLPILVIRRVIFLRREKDFIEAEVKASRVKEFIFGFKSQWDLNKYKNVLIGLVISTAISLLIPYSSNFGRAIGRAQTFTENLVPFIVLLGLAIASRLRMNANIQFAVLLPLAYWHLVDKLYYATKFFIGNDQIRLGGLLSLINFMLILVLLFKLWPHVYKNFHWTSNKLNDAVIGSAIGIILVIGSWMNWQRVTKTITEGENTWKINNERVTSSDCCTLFDSPEIWTSQLLDLLKVLGIFITLYLLIYIFSGVELGFGIVSLGLICLTDSLSWLSTVFPSYVDPKEYGFTSRQIAEMGLIVTKSPLIGGWIALTAATAYVFFGLYILGKAKALETQ